LKTIKTPIGRLALYGVLSAAALMSAGCAVSSLHLAHRSAKATSPEEKSRAESYFVKARTYEMLGQKAEAIRCYGAAYALDPQSQTLRDILVEKYAASGQLTRALLLIKGNAKGGRLSDADNRLCAGIYLREGKIGAAAELLRDIRSKGPDDFYTLGFIEESQGNLEKAAEFFSAFLALRPESLPLWVKVGALYTSLKKFPAAESLYVRMESRFGQSPEVFNGIGSLKLARGDTAQAVSSFKTASLLDSTDTESMRNLAQIFMRQGAFEEAIPYYQKLYTINRHSDPYGRALAMLYYYTRHFDKAQAMFDSLLAENGNDYELHFFNGLALAARDSIGRARVEFSKTIDSRSDFADGWEQLCYLEMRAKRLDSSLAVAKRFTTAMPKSPESWRMEGYLYSVSKEYAKAIVSLEKSVELDSADAFSWFELGSALERNHDREKSVAAFRRVLRLKPGDPAAANYLGYMWAERGENLDSALMLIKTALVKDSLNGAYLDSYAWVFYKRGELDSAFVYIVKAMTRIDDDPSVFHHYGDILQKRGDVAGALAAYRKGLSLSASDNASEEEVKAIRETIQRLLKAEPNRGATPPVQIPSVKPVRP